MSIALVFIIAGLIICFGAFVFAAINILRHIIDKDPFWGLDRMFKRHIGAMIVIVFGVLLFFVGIILLSVDIINRAIK